MSDESIQSKGGKARAAALTSERRTEIASNAAKVRWNKTNMNDEIRNVVPMNADIVTEPKPQPDATPEAIMQMVENNVAQYKPTLRDRISWRLFPPNYRKWPDNIPQAATLKGHMFSNTVIYLGWQDRLRVLISGRIRCEVMTLMDMQPTKYHSVSAIETLPPKCLENKI